MPHRLILAVAGAASLAATMALADARGDYLEQCARCHGVASAGIAPAGRRAAADLSGSAEKGGAPWLFGYIGPTATVPHPRPFKGTDEELQALVDWLVRQ